NRMLERSRAEAFATGTRGSRVGILHLETAILQGVDVIQFAARNIERALWIDDHAHSGAFHQNIPAGRRVLQIHFGLQPEATAAHHGHAQATAGPAVLGEQRRHLASRAGRELDQALVAYAISWRGLLRFRSGSDHGRKLTCRAGNVNAGSGWLELKG